MENKINIFLFKPEGKENFGEYLCKSIIREIGFELNNYSNSNPISKPLPYILTGIGGFLNTEIYSMFLTNAEKWYVWGSGVHCIPKPGHQLSNVFLREKCIISMVRGPLTRDYYNLPVDTLLGDAGYLASYYFPLPKSDHGLPVIIQHHYDVVSRNIPGVRLTLKALMSPNQVGSFTHEFLYRLQCIAQADIVLTSSMHVAVVAYSYGVPFAIIQKRETDITHEWKWYDFLQNIGITKTITAVNSIDEAWQWWNSVKDQVRPITREYQQKIIDAFPFKISNES